MNIINALSVIAAEAVVEKDKALLNIQAIADSSSYSEDSVGDIKRHLREYALADQLLKATQSIAPKPEKPSPGPGPQANDNTIPFSPQEESKETA
jgi:hypothetical protein